MPKNPVGSPEWWLERLHKELGRRRPEVERNDGYYEGQHKLAFATDKFREAFGSLFRAFADNWCGIVVDAVEERLNIEGFRFGEDVEGDRDAWAIWQRNGLDAGSQLVHTEALVTACGYVLVQPDEEGEPLITPEAAAQCIVAYEPGTRRRAAGLKEWWDDWTGFIYATVYLPDGIWKFQTEKALAEATVETGEMSSLRWIPRKDLPETESRPLTNDLGVVPLVPFENRPRLTRPPQSEIRSVIPIQDAVNKLCADMMVAAEFQAFRQRVLMGVEVPTDPETGQPLEVFKHATNRLWFIDKPDAKVFEFGTVDLGNFTKAIEMYVSHIASQTRTPPHYFERPGGQFPSGESIKAAETGLVAKAGRKMRHFEESWEEVIRLAFALKGDPRQNETSAETIWGDPESRTESEHIDAVVKTGSIGVPEEQLWEDAGYSPQQIERFKRMRAEQAQAQPPQLVLSGAPAADGNGNGQGGSYGG